MRAVADLRNKSKPSLPSIYHLPVYNILPLSLSMSLTANYPNSFYPKPALKAKHNLLSVVLSYIRDIQFDSEATRHYQEIIPYTLPHVLRRVEACMELFPDSALSLLSQIECPECMRGQQRADYALLLTQALDKNYLDNLQSDSLIMIAVEYYKQEGDKLKAGKAYFYSSNPQPPS